MMTIAKVGTPTTPSIGLLALLDNPEQVRQTIAEYESAKQAAIEEQNKAAQAVAQANALKAEMDKRDKAQAKREAKISEATQSLLEGQVQLAKDRDALANDIEAIKASRAEVNKQLQANQQRASNLSQKEFILAEREREVGSREATVLAREQDVERRVAALKELIGA